MFSFLKSLFFTPKEISKTIYDSQWGKLTCVYTEEDEFFSWDTLLHFDFQKQGITFSFFGTVQGPDRTIMNDAAIYVNRISELQQLVQSFLSKTYAKEGVDLNQHYYISDVTFYNDSEVEDCEVSIEYDSERDDYLQKETYLVSVYMKKGEIVNSDIT